MTDFEKKVLDYKYGGHSPKFFDAGFFAAAKKEAAGLLALARKQVLDEQRRAMQGEILDAEVERFLDESGAPYLWCNDEDQKEWCKTIAKYFWNKALSGESAKRPRKH